MMRRKRLGRTELLVPIVGIGTAFTGIPTQNETVSEYEGAPSKVDRELGVEALVAAMDAGCPLFRYRRALWQERQRIPDWRGAAAATRVQRRDDHLDQSRAQHLGYDYSFDGIVRSVHASLGRMGLERVAIVHIHDAMGQPMDKVLADDGAFGGAAAFAKPRLAAAYRHGRQRPGYQPGLHPDRRVRRGGDGGFLEFDQFDRAGRGASRRRRGTMWASSRRRPLERGLLVTGPLAGVKYLNRRFSQACLDQGHAHPAALRAL